MRNNRHYLDKDVIRLLTSFPVGGWAIIFFCMQATLGSQLPSIEPKKYITVMLLRSTSTIFVPDPLQYFEPRSLSLTSPPYFVPSPPFPPKWS